LPSHFFRPDGLLLLNPDGRHPVYDLTERAEAAWKAKLGQASTTYEQLVAEYGRRYGRAPPPGFRKWWKYVQEHDVQLPDEYDQIYHDLQPFWGIKPADLRRILAEWEHHQDTYTLGKEEGGSVLIVAEKLPEDHAKRENLLVGGNQMLKLLAGIGHLLPPFRAVFSPHDSASVFIDYQTRSMTLKAAAAGNAPDTKELPRPRMRGWVTACPPESPALTKQLYTPKDAKSFIYDHRAAMDPCKHPSLLREHGQFVAHDVGPYGLQTPVPLFSYSSSAIHSDIHTTPTLSWVEDVLPREVDPEFKFKVDNRLLWRGANTGIRHDSTKEWKLSQRNRLVALVNEQNGTTIVLPAHVSPFEKVGTGDEVNKVDVNPILFDVAFAGRPLSCGEDECQELLEIYDWRGYQNISEAGKYKYVLDVDGNGWSSRFKRLMTSNSLIFKATVYPEWFTDRIQPWVHYIPVKYDYSDVHDLLTFFRGDLLGRGAHEEMAGKIAGVGREWSKTFWRTEDMVAYMFRLLLEYARVMREDRDVIS
ncbi:glycosyl transferase family 90-domain-containing protein, partial [Pisolithus orientalis]|uniref:glycosyl transferase family 90-domain-containing protein n=1 Tax=Pisolithus orientalis TaxID=936130 RepID=UPI002224B66E